MNDANKRSSSRTLWHRLLAKLLSLLLIPVKILVQSELFAANEPPKIDVLLLRTETKQWNEEQRALLPDGIRDRHMANHLLECKITESVTNQALQQVLVYDYLYRQSKQLALDEIQCYIVSAKTPLPEKMTEWGYQVAEHPGVYVTKTPVLDRVILLILNELREEPHNDYFRLFASRKKVRLSAFERLQRAHIRVSSDISSILFALRKAYDLEELVMMNEEMTMEDLLVMGESLRKHALATASIDEHFEGEKGEEVRKYALATAPIDEHFEGEKGEEVRKRALATSSIDERLEGIETAEILAKIEPEQRLAGLDVEDMQALMKQIEHYLATQKSSGQVISDESESGE